MRNGVIEPNSATLNVTNGDRKVTENVLKDANTTNQQTLLLFI